MRLLELPPGDIAYFVSRLLLCGVAIAVAVTGLQYAWLARCEGRRWRIATVGSTLLVAGAGLSAHDAIDNVLLSLDAPLTLLSWLWFFLFDALLPLWGIQLIAAWRERDRTLAELSRLSVTDQLTGALNRRGFFDRAVTSIAQARRSDLAGALIMFDIDRFKAINDRYGHGAGDEVLRGVVTALMAAMRPGDLIGRMGGEEFAVFLHNTTNTAAISIADRLRGCVQSSVIDPAGSQVTVSGGVASIRNSLEPEAALSLALSAADEALYAAKRNGRDRVVSAFADSAISEETH